MTAPLTSACPVCIGPIQASQRGRPAIYCGKPCRQAAHRARDRAARELQDLARLQRRLAAGVEPKAVHAVTQGQSLQCSHSHICSASIDAAHP